MGYDERMRKAKEETRQLAKEMYGRLKSGELDWEDMKSELKDFLRDKKHYVYSISAEINDSQRKRGDVGHVERALIYLQLKQVFHSELRKYPRLGKDAI
jgi:hypothetical protein